MDLSKYENQRDQADDDDVSGHHVGKKTDDQCERFGEYTQQFHGEHNENPYGKRHTWKPKDMGPEMFVCAGHDHEEGDNAQYSSECDITRHIR